MKYQEKIISQMGNTLRKEVYTILDSRIQYIEYVAQSRLNIGKINDAASLNSGKSADLLNNFEQMLTYLGELNQSLKLLQILKSWLTDDNVQLIFQLLTNKKYMNYSEERLEYILKKGIIVEPVYR